jgi:spermidine/putrescine transport system permease protein
MSRLKSVKVLRPVSPSSSGDHTGGGLLERHGRFGVGRRPRDAFGKSLLALTLLWSLPLCVLPFVMMILYSFATQNFLTGKVTFGWTFSAWSQASTSIIYQAFFKSVLLSTGATLACAVIGYPLAYFIAFKAGRFRGLALLMLIIPFWVSFVVRAYAWIAILNNQGNVNHILMDLGLITSPVQLVYNDIGIGIGLVYGYLPLMVFPLYLALDRIQPQTIEAALDLGASPRRTFWRLVFPESLPGLVAGCTIVWIPALGEYVIPAILGGGKSYMIGNVVAQYVVGGFQWPVAAVIAVVLVFLAIAVLGVVAWRLGSRAVFSAGSTM